MIHPSLDTVPAAVFAARKILSHTPGFASRFFSDPDGKAPNFTLNTFLGDRNIAVARELKQLPAGATRDYELRLNTPKGEAYFQIAAFVAVTDDERTVTLVLHDIHAFVSRIRTLEESEARARVLVETRTAALAIVRNGLFLYVNKGFLELFGYMLREDLIGKEVAVIVAGREKKGVTEHAQRALEETTPPERFEFTGRRKDGSRIHVQVLDELIEPDGEPARLWYFVDISHLRNEQEDVERNGRQNEILQHILESLHRSVERPVLVRDSLHACLRWFGYEAGAVLVVNDERNAFQLEQTENISEKIAAVLASVNMTEGFGGFMVKTMEPVRFTIAEYPAYLPYRALFEGEGVRRVLFFPLGGENGPAGIMLLFSMKDVEQEPTSAAFLGLACGHLGFALSKAVKYNATGVRATALETGIESLAGVVYDAAPTGVFRYLSPAVERLTGYTIAEITRTPDAWRAMVHPDDRSMVSERITRQSGSEQEFALEYRILPKGKAAYRVVRDMVRYRRDANGMVEAIHGFVADITDRSESKADCSHVEDMTRGIVDAMSDALMMTDLQGKILDVNNAFSMLTGYTRAEAIGYELPYPWLQEAQMAAYVHWLDALRESQRVTDFDMQWVRRDGATIAISVSTTILRNAAGDPIAILNIARDINERQRQGEEIRQANRQLSLVNAIGLGLTGASDAPTVLNEVHEHLKDAIGYSTLVYRRFDRVAGTLTRVYCGGDACGIDQGYSENADQKNVIPLTADHGAAEVIRTDASWLGEQDGEATMLVPVVTRGATLGVLRFRRPAEEPFGDGDLRMASSIATLVAIALERVALHEATVASAREIARRNEELDRFAYVVSHDLKEPLITISGYTRLAIEDGGVRMSDESKQHLESVMRAVARMKQLIDDLLTLSRVGRPAHQVPSIPVSQVLSDVLRDLEFLLVDRHARVEFPPDMPVVPYDSTHLAMVFRNLIVNGIKYNRTDVPVIRIAATEAPTEWTFSVADNGIGIEPGEFQKIFMVFQRLNPADGIGGTGAGLTIVKQIVESYGGTIRVESEPDGGSTFTFTVPRHD
jgi:PAS domain S-box-containing protein